MEHLPSQPNGQVLPHIVQVYQQTVTESAKIQNPQIIHISHPSLQSANGTLTYQQTPSQPQHIGTTQMLHTQQMHTLQSCSQIQLRASVQTSQVIHQDMSPALQPLQITQHMILPVFKQHMVVNNLSQNQQNYVQYYQKEETSTLVPKVEHDIQGSSSKAECKVEISISNCDDTEPPRKPKRNRSVVPDPTKWACNIRKTKHQRGEAYISRRGKYVPERRVHDTKDCLKSCKYKCNQHIDNIDREHIFKAFYSLSVNEKKHFLLNTTERNYTKRSTRALSNEEAKRKYSFKYFFLVRAVRYTVCKNFYLGTLAISQKPVYNVHLGKSEMNIPKPDGRGLSEASSHGVPSELKERVRQHIMSFTTVDSKPVRPYSKKKQHLDPSLSMKQMYLMYVNACDEDNAMRVKESMYRKILKSEFNLNFRKLKVAQVLCSRCKGPVDKK